jgi:hypothetical protein
MRTTIMASEELLDKLRRMAHERRTSMATIIREALEEKVRSHHPRPRSIGLGDSGRSDISATAGDRSTFEPRAWR